MTYATYFLDGGKRGLLLATGSTTAPTPDGGPWLVEYVPSPGDDEHCSRHAERMLARHVRRVAPAVFRQGVHLKLWSPIRVRVVHSRSGTYEVRLCEVETCTAPGRRGRPWCYRHDTHRCTYPRGCKALMTLPGQRCEQHSPEGLRLRAEAEARAQAQFDAAMLRMRDELPPEQRAAFDARHRR